MSFCPSATRYCIQRDEKVRKYKAETEEKDRGLGEGGKREEGRKGLLIAVLHDKITGLFIYGAIGVGVFFSLTA